jgi:ribosomal protein S27AE
MLAFLVKDCMKQPKEMTLTELRPYMAEYLRRKRGTKPAKPRVLKACKECGEMLTARQRRYACPKCGTYNREAK